MKCFTARPLGRGDVVVALEEPTPLETTMSSFENVAFGTMMGGWMVMHGLYVLQVLGLS